MNQLDIFYRALKNYRRETGKNDEYLSFRNTVAKSDIQGEKIQIEYNVCTVETDWMDAIEDGMEFIAKAIAEERQFIRSNGEVVPVEKAKHVSKDSVVHLAKHSNLITTEPEEGEDLLPEKIYVVERLSDYAVYENRFLYMLLCFLRDFISMRYNKILAAANTYQGALTIKKTITHRRRKIEYTANMVEENRDDPYLAEHNGLQDVLTRMSLLLKTVMHYLSTPLMQETAKTPILKPPITKTNVLKMNHNFRGAMALYEYVAAYPKDGFTVTKETKVLAPFRVDVADEFAEVLMLSSFLTYEHGMGIESDLQKNFEEEEIRRKEEEERKLVEQIEKLRKRAKKEAGDMEKYMLLLEKRNKQLEDIAIRLAEMKKLKEELELKLAEAQEEIKERDRIIAKKERALQAEIEGREKDRLEHEREMAELIEKHRLELEELVARNEEERAELIRVHESEKEEMNKAHEDEKSELIRVYEEEKAGIVKQYEDEKETLLQDSKAEKDELIATYTEEKERMLAEHFEEKEEMLRTNAEEKEEMVRRHVKEVNELLSIQDDMKKQAEEAEEAFAKEKEEVLIGYQEEREKLAGERMALEEEIKRKQEEIEAHIEEKEVIMARLNGLRRQQKLITDKDEFTSEASFNELELEYRAFTKLFHEEKRKVKKKIRKEVLSDI